MTAKRYGVVGTIISKSFTYLGLAIVIVGIYSAIVVGPVLVIGGWDDGGPGLMLPVVASAVVAVLFEPIRSRLERAANRLVYGDRVSPYQVLSQVTSSLPAVAAEDGTAVLSQLLARGTGAERAIVWVASGGMLQPSGISPDSAQSAVGPLAIDGLSDDDVTESRPVLHHGVPFGALTIIKPRNDPVTPADRQLLSDVAAAGRYARAVDEMPGISLRTVYTTLTDLVEMGELTQLHLDAGPARFDPIPDDHHHVRCSSCGEVADVGVDGTQSLRVEGLHGFQPTCLSILFHGVCPDCAAVDRSN